MDFKHTLAVTNIEECFQVFIISILLKTLINGQTSFQ